MSDLQVGSWKVTDRRPILRYEVDPVMAPWLRIDRRIGIKAECPAGHAMPFEATADERVVRAMGESGVTIGCKPCGVNYNLDLGSWPDPFPDHAATK